MLQRLINNSIITRHRSILIPKFKTNIKQRYFSSNLKAPRICIVGAGPAGFYAAQYILKTLTECRVDVIEKLPVPFGLVR